MRIAQVAPLFESVPPAYYGGTERVVSYLTEELVRLGHEVTLFASGDSTTAAELVPICERSLRLNPACVDQLPYMFLMLELVFRQVERFDVVHFHVDYCHFPLSRRYQPPRLTTLHGRLDIPDLEPLYREFATEPLVSISDAQRRPLPWVNWLATLHHGLPVDLYQPSFEPGSYLAFVGRISPEKRCDRAIEIAKQLNRPLKIAAKVDAQDRTYFEQEIRPLLRHPLIEFMGEVSTTAKNELLAGASALLFPIDWPEPFGLVMIEAMACGTPVIAFPWGSVPEILEDGVSGFIVQSMDEAVEATKRVEALDRRGCRAVFERRFTAERMARDYLRLYERAAAERIGEPQLELPNADQPEASVAE